MVQPQMAQPQMAQPQMGQPQMGQPQMGQPPMGSMMSQPQAQGQVLGQQLGNSDWYLHYTADGEVYYFNMATNATSWDRPAGL